MRGEAGVQAGQRMRQLLRLLSSDLHSWYCSPAPQAGIRVEGSG